MPQRGPGAPLEASDAPGGPDCPEALKRLSEAALF